MVFTILSAILHMTNIRFSHDEETDGVFIEDEYPLEVGKSSTLRTVTREIYETISLASVYVTRTRTRGVNHGADIHIQFHER